MTNIAVDTFSRSNQSGFGTASDGSNVWGSPTAGSTSISSNEGIFSGSSFGDAQVACGSHSGTTDINFLVRCKSSDTSNLFGILWRWSSGSSNGYRCGFYNGTTFNVDKYSGGSRSNITSFSFSYSTGTSYWIRMIHTSGGTLQIRVWADGSSEPGTWNVNQSETTYSSGNFGFSIYGGNSGNNNSYDSLTVTDNSSLTTSTRTIPTTAALLKTSTRTISTSVALLTTKTRTIPTHAALLVTSKRTITTSAALLVSSHRTISNAAALLKASSRTIPDSAALLQTDTRTIPTSAAILQTNKRTIGSHAALLVASKRTITSSAALLQTDTRTIPDTAALLTTRTRTLPAHAALLVTSKRTIAGSAAILQTNKRTIGAYAALLQTQHRTIQTSAALTNYNPAPPQTNALVYVHSGQVAAYVHSGQATVYTN